MPKKKTKDKHLQKAPEDYIPKTFLDCIAPTVVRFNVEDFILGSTYRCVWAIHEYPTSTEEPAILRRLGEQSGVVLHIYTRRVTPAEERAILHNAANRNRLNGTSQDVTQNVTAVDNLQDVTTLISNMNRTREPLVHCAVFIEMTAQSKDDLKLLQGKVLTELTRSKINVDRLLLRQREGFLSVNPAGYNMLGPKYERVLPASSAANLFPFHYSGKTDPHGFYIGKDKYGSNIIVDFDRRDSDKTTANILILGSSGQGKSFLMKLLLCNLLEEGKSVIALDSEHEQEDLSRALGGCYIDLLSGQYRINMLEPKCWDDGSGEDDPDAPQAFQKHTKLSQHISFLRDSFRGYKDFDYQHIDVLELMVTRLYQKWGISDETDFTKMMPTDYPILSDLYEFMEQTYQNYGEDDAQLYQKRLLQDLLLGLHSMCRGADSRFFNGYTNITSARFLVFGVKGLDNVAKNLRDTLLFNLLSYLSDQLLTAGNTVAALDELYLWLYNPTAVTYIRNCMKRVRKQDSAMLLASQNLEDFDQPGIRELTRPLFSIPTHQFLFNAGSIDKKFYMDNLQLEPAEYETIRQPHRGECLYKCGVDRFLLQVKVPSYKEMLFGDGGGK